jgi:hypothetical protein
MILFLGFLRGWAFCLREKLKQLRGVDLVSIDGIGELTTQIILPELLAFARCAACPDFVLART